MKDEINITENELLANWDCAIVDLNRNKGMFKGSDVRLRDCSLHYNNGTCCYFVSYRGVTYGIHDIYNFRLHNDDEG